MNIADFIKRRAMRLLGLAKLDGNPDDGRLTYINDDEAIRRSNVRANRIWYMGDGDELLNWYTNQQTYGWAENPIYNRNRRDYFWGRSVNENVKRIHSGVPRAIVDTISNVVGMPTITANRQDELDAILKANDFDFLLTQVSRPMALVEGDGAWKVNLNPDLSPYPIVERFGAEDWYPIYKSNVLIGMAFSSYYKDADGKDYVLVETRLRAKGGTRIEFRLFRLGKGNVITPIPMDTLPETASYKDYVLKGVDSLLAVPLKYYFDPLRRNRGKSLFDGRLDLFDFLDEILTQAGQTNRVSTPVEYYPVDLLQRSDRGVPELPKVYNRQYVKLDTTPDGNGDVSMAIQTTQPNLEFGKYAELYGSVLSDVLIGALSPSSLGLNVSRDDNALAQREKEKQTIFTRNTIIKNETKALEALCGELLLAWSYLKTGRFVPEDWQVGVKYDEFANPSFETELQTLGPAWSQGQLSTDRFVKLLWGGKLSDDELEKEREWLDANREKDEFDMGYLDEKGTGRRLPAEGKGEGAPEDASEPLPRKDLRGDAEGNAD